MQPTLIHPQHPSEAPAVTPAAPRPGRPSRLSAAIAAAGVAALLCGVFVHANGYVWLAAAAVVLAVGFAWPWLVVRATSATIDFAAERGREGVPARATLVVRGRLPWGVGGLRLEGGGLPGRDVAAGTTELRWTPGRFGPVAAGGLALTCDRPFGLWTARRAVRVPGEMIVWPATHGAGPVPDCGGDVTGTHSGRRVGIGGEFCGVRDFRPGDRLRLIHWAQSARHDRLVVRETLADATPRVRVGLTLARDAHADAAAFDDAVRDAASKVEGWTRAGSVVELVLSDRRVGCPPNATPRAALDALARLTFDDLPETAPAAEGVDVYASAGGAA